jgi:Fe2+ or Zn2+ uptake regulation protein
MTKASIIELLQSKGYKITDSRTMLLDILFENIHQLLTIESLYDFMIKKKPTLNKSTLYRNIETLQSLNLLFKKVGQNATASYKLICSNKHHHHMICDACGKIVVYDQCDFEKYDHFASANGFHLTGHTLELHGICEKCCEKTS